MATDASGAVVWQASYTPFGGIRQVSVDTGALSAQEMRFPGQWFQAETGYHQNWHRDYDPTTGRYLQADPLGLIDGPSVYGYVRQNPLNGIDPTGLFDPSNFDPVGGLRDPDIELFDPGMGGFGAAGALGLVCVLSPESCGGSSIPEPVDNPDDCSECPPCRPYPEGTIGYREDDHPVNIPDVDDKHLNLYRVNQNKKNCKCFWNRHTPYHVNGPLQPDWVKLQSTGRGPRNTFPTLYP